MTDEELINTVNRIRLRSIVLKDETLSTTRFGLMSSADLKNEEAILGSFLKEGHRFSSDLFLFLLNDDFYTLENQLIFKTLTKLYNKSNIINYNIVIRELESDNTLKTIGGLRYIEKLKNRALTETQFDYIDSKIESCSIVFYRRPTMTPEVKLINAVNKLRLRYIFSHKI